MIRCDMKKIVNDCYEVDRIDMMLKYEYLQVGTAGHGTVMLLEDTIPLIIKTY